MRQAPGPLVEVEWVDSMQFAPWVDRYDLLEKLKVDLIDLHTSAGYQILDNDDCIALVGSYGESSNVADCMRIPKVAVRVVRVIRPEPDVCCECCVEVDDAEEVMPGPTKDAARWFTTPLDPLIRNGTGDPIPVPTVTACN